MGGPPEGLGVVWRDGMGQEGLPQVWEWSGGTGGVERASQRAGRGWEFSQEGKEDWESLQ